MVLLSLGLSMVAQAEIFDRQYQGDTRGSEKQLHQRGSGLSEAANSIEGEVLRVEGNECVIKEQDGKEVRLHIDQITLKASKIGPGDRIEVLVNDKNDVLSFRPAVMP